MCKAPRQVWLWFGRALPRLLLTHTVVMSLREPDLNLRIFFFRL